MRARSLISFGIAILAGIAAAFATAHYMKGPDRVPILVARADLHRSAVLSEDLFELRELPAGMSVPSHAVTAYEQVRERARDHVLKHPMKAGDTLTMDNIIPKARGGLPTLLRAGYVGFGVQATPLNTFGAHLRPDQYVNVIGASKSVPGHKAGYQTLMKNIRVVAVDQNVDPSPDQQAGRVPAVIVLEVTGSEATKLREAQDRGPLSLTLVALGDQHDLAHRAGDKEESEDPRMVTILTARRDLEDKTPLGDARELFQTQQVREIDAPARAVTRLDELDDLSVLARSMKANEVLLRDHLENRERKPDMGPTLTVIDRRYVKVWMWKPDGTVVLHRNYLVPGHE